MKVLVLITCAFEVFKFDRLRWPLRRLVNSGTITDLFRSFRFRWTTLFVPCFATFGFFALLSGKDFNSVLGCTVLTAVPNPAPLVVLS